VWGLTPHKIHSLVGCSSVMGMFQQLTTDYWRHCAERLLNAF
jgi:hypothetical protein